MSLVKNWYLKVQEEAMAPARMVAFMEKHILQCEECLADPDVKQEVEKIRKIVLPPSKVPKPKAVRVAKEEVAGEEEAAKKEVAGEEDVAKEEVAGEEDVEEDTDSDCEDTENDLDDDDDPEPDEIDDDVI
jgi:hypothetical protein